MSRETFAWWIQNSIYYPVHASYGYPRTTHGLKYVISLHLDRGDDPSGKSSNFNLGYNKETIL
ncbi:11301_t:CDS:2 [Ambispora leptoticha]|uniref:11301_t:CDS:1 n=1 Tax=Ambispora leptoticha TaxID=144679 RepID=A0A9N9CJP1_9GLOM|nr:11301_t:CDS:2 [Ambispora leptoticha]